MAYTISKASKLFDHTSRRADAMLTASKAIFNGLAPNPRPADWTYNSRMFSDMGRAAVVIAVAAFDDYHTRRFAEAVIPCLKKKGPSDRLVDLFSKAGITLRDSLELLTMERPHRRIRAHIDAYLSDYTTQRFVAIDDLFGALGLKDFSANVERKAGRKRMRRSIEKLVLRRHDIVHGGDLTQSGKLQDIDPDDALMRMNLMKEFVTHADQIVYSCVS